MNDKTNQLHVYTKIKQTQTHFSHSTDKAQYESIQLSTLSLHLVITSCASRSAISHLHIWCRVRVKVIIAGGNKVRDCCSCSGVLSLEC